LTLTTREEFYVWRRLKQWQLQDPLLRRRQHVERYGCGGRVGARLLRYVFRVRDESDVNIRLVRVGTAVPYVYNYRRGRNACLHVRLALRARARHLGIWGRCPGTPWDLNHGVSTEPR
jgi:endonuclease YncB( thermonuclease family)